MTRLQINARISAKTRSQVDALAERWGCSITEVLTVAIDRLYQTETKKRRPKHDKPAAIQPQS